MSHLARKGLALDKCKSENGTSSCPQFKENGESRWFSFHTNCKEAARKPWREDTRLLWHPTAFRTAKKGIESYPE